MMTPMCFVLTVLLLVTTAVVVEARATTTGPSFIPTRIPYQEFLDRTNAGVTAVVLEELRTIGMISITDLPGKFPQLKHDLFEQFQHCLRDHPQHVPEFALDDAADQHPDAGSATETATTQRFTIATQTAAGHPEDIFVGLPQTSGLEVEGEQDDATTPGVSESSSSSSSCQRFREHSERFRQSIQHVSEALAAQLGHAEEAETTSSPSTLMTDRDGTEYTIYDLIQQGDHLEHFHAYTTTTTGIASSSAREPPTTTTHHTATTIDWHTDQGLALLFTPGQLSNGRATSGFYIRLPTGSPVEVQFDTAIDDVVIMLGDGIEYYNHPRSTTHPEGNEEEVENAAAAAAVRRLRAVPHALSLSGSSTTTTAAEPRFWYGRMVLPPMQALHPQHPAYTFGELRAARMHHTKNDTTITMPRIGCSSDTLQLGVQAHRRVAEDPQQDATTTTTAADDECDPETELYCWMTCMAYNDTSVSDVPSPTACDATKYLKALGMPMCMNDSGDVWTPEDRHDPSMRIMCGGSDGSERLITSDVPKTTTVNNDGTMKDKPSSAAPFFRYGAITGISSSTVVALATVGLFLFL